MKSSNRNCLEMTARRDQEKVKYGISSINGWLRIVVSAVCFSILAMPALEAGTIVWNTDVDPDGDWPDPGPPPVLTHTVNEDGYDVEWEFSGDTTLFDKNGPDDTNRLKGGVGGGTAGSLEWRFKPDFATESITLEISFIDEVTLTSALSGFTSFTLYDIDREDPDPTEAQWADQVTIVGNLAGGGTVDPTFTITDTNFVGTVGTDTLIGLDKVNNADAAGNVLVEFSDNIIGVTLTFTDQGGAGFQDGKDHEIGFRDLNFTPVPEPATAFLLALTILSRVVFFRRRPR